MNAGEKGRIHQRLVPGAWDKHKRRLASRHFRALMEDSPDKQVADG